MSDSLALPREKPETVLLQNTWPALLKERGFQIHQVSIGGATSRDLLKQCGYYNFFKGEAVIVQVGIVDCAPRFVSKIEKDVLTKIPFVGRRILGFLNNPYIKRHRSLTYTSLKEFESNIVNIKKSFPLSKVFFTEIIGGQGYEKILPGVDLNIKKYNEVLNSLFPESFIKYSKDGIVMSDFHHLNTSGHRALFEKLGLSL